MKKILFSSLKKHFSTKKTHIKTTFNTLNSLLSSESSSINQIYKSIPIENELLTQISSIINKKTPLFSLINPAQPQKTKENNTNTVISNDFLNNSIILERKINENYLQIRSNSPNFNNKPNKKRFPTENNEEIMKILEETPSKIPFYILFYKEIKQSPAEVCINKEGLFINGIIEEGQIQFDYIYYSNDLETYQFLFKRGIVSRESISRDFSSIDRELQERIYSFLFEIGFNQELVDCIERICLIKERILFRRWYENAILNLVD